MGRGRGEAGGLNDVELRDEELRSPKEWVDPQYPTYARHERTSTHSYQISEHATHARHEKQAIESEALSLIGLMVMTRTMTLHHCITDKAAQTNQN